MGCSLLHAVLNIHFILDKYCHGYVLKVVNNNDPRRMFHILNCYVFNCPHQSVNQLNIYSYCLLNHYTSGFTSEIMSLFHWIIPHLISFWAFYHVGMFCYSYVFPLCRISPSDGDSVVSDYSSERESTEENLRGHVTPIDSKHTRKNPINVLNGEQPW